MTDSTGLQRASEERPIANFYTPVSSSLLARQPRTLKHGHAFGLFNDYGDIFPDPESAEGLYYADTRYLSGFQLRVNGEQPVLLSSSRADNVSLMLDLTNPDILVNGVVVLPGSAMHIARRRFLWDGTCYERLTLRSFDDKHQVLRLSIAFAADFADIFEVRGQKRSARGALHSSLKGQDTILLEYHGLDHVMRRTAIRFEPAPAALDTREARFLLPLAPGQRCSLFITISCLEGASFPPTERRFFPALKQARRAFSRSRAQAATIESSNALFNEVLQQSMSDVFTLLTQSATGSYPYAGIPWYCTEFGRDGIITAMELLWIEPAIARGVLRFLADTQATQYDASADAEPGKILHEMRRSEMARLGEVPFGRYYGTVDATPLFVMLAGMYYQQTGDLSFVSQVWPAIVSALRWMDDCADRDGDGFLEYHRLSADGLVNQGWKDSTDSVFHANGRLAAGPIALCEVQAYAYSAKCHAARLARALGFDELSSTLSIQAGALRERFEQAFWSERLGTYVLALDGEKHQCEVPTSNAGHALFAGIANAERAGRVAERLMRADFFSGWGIRTVATSAARYNPMSYHNGSIWPHDNALIALGFARYGLTGYAERLLTGLFDTAVHMDFRRLPELFCGFHRSPGSGPTSYPVACSPQAWASAVPFALLRACIGLDLDHQAAEIRFSHPRLPAMLDMVWLRSLRLGSARFDLQLRRHARDVTVNLIEKEGDARVTITL
jgi:glycogen debranching enzyme